MKYMVKGVLEKVPEIHHFMTFRYEDKEIEQFVQNMGWSVLECQRFIAYEKVQGSIPIYYIVILAKK